MLVLYLFLLCKIYLKEVLIEHHLFPEMPDTLLNTTSKTLVAISSFLQRESTYVDISESEFERLKGVVGGRKVSQNEQFQLICFLLYKCGGQDPNSSGFPASVQLFHHFSLARTLIPEHYLQNHLLFGV